MHDERVDSNWPQTSDVAGDRGRPDSVIADLIPDAFIRALVHDAEGNPPDATNRRRHPNGRQKRFVKERDKTCVDCGRHQLLEYDHVPAYQQTGHTITTELQLRCAPCHHNRHRSSLTSGC